MNIDSILSELNVKHKCKRNSDFETLGLIESDTKKNICTFVAEKKYLSDFNSNVSVVITTEEVATEIENVGVCIVDNPRYTFFLLHNYLCKTEEYIRLAFKTKIGNKCSISDMSYIADKNVIIGDNVTIEEFVSIKENVVIGNNSIIRAGTIVGGIGFEQKRHGDTVMSVEHAGGVIIGENVELQQSNCIDRAIYPWDDTIIGDYCRTDNKVHIAHAVKMKPRVLIAACTCVAGRVVIGEDVWIGPGVTVINGIHIGKNARVNIGSVATKDVPENGAVTGNFAIEHKKFIENMKKIR